MPQDTAPSATDFVAHRQQWDAQLEETMEQVRRIIERERRSQQNDRTEHTEHTEHNDDNDHSMHQARREDGRSPTEMSQQEGNSPETQ